MYHNEIPMDNDELILQSSSYENKTVWFNVKLKQSGTYLFAAGQPAGFGRKGFLRSHYGWTYVTGDAGDQIEAKISFAPSPNWTGGFQWYLGRFRAENEIPTYINLRFCLFYLVIFFLIFLIALLMVFVNVYR
jgi:hypothetical protein